MSGLTAPPGRQGPGPMPGALVEALDALVAPRAGGVLPGDHRGIGLGAGTELAQLRPYIVGDDVRLLDAASTARTGVPHVRLHVPERTLTTWVLVDVSPSMAFGTADRLKSDVAEGVARALGRLAVRRGGRVAGMLVGARAGRFLPPRGGRRALVALSGMVGDGVAPDGHGDPRALEAALRRVGKMARTPGLVAVVSDFREVSEWPTALGAVAARHGVLAVEVRDRREGDLPAVGHLTLVDPESGRLVEADTSSARLRERFAAAEAERRERVAAALRRVRARHVVVATEGDWLRQLGRGLR